MLDLSLLYFPKYDKQPPKIILENLNDDFILVRGYKSKNVVKIPKTITPNLAYLIGCILGDGHIATPLKRKKGGCYWIIGMTCENKYADIVSDMIFNVFSYRPIISPHKRGAKCVDVKIHSIIIHRYFNRVFGIPYGPKRGKTPWVDDVCKSKNIFRHFLAGLIDTDDYVSFKYAAIIQKDKTFLEKVKTNSEKILGIKFKGPTPNRKIDGNVVGWWIRINKSNLKEFIEEIPLKYRAPLAQLG